MPNMNHNYLSPWLLSMLTNQLLEQPNYLGRIPQGLMILFLKSNKWKQIPLKWDLWINFLPLCRFEWGRHCVIQSFSCFLHKLLVCMLFQLVCIAYWILMCRIQIWMWLPLFRILHDDRDQHSKVSMQLLLIICSYKIWFFTLP